MNAICSSLGLARVVTPRAYRSVDFSCQRTLHTVESALFAAHACDRFMPPPGLHWGSCSCIRNRANQPIRSLTSTLSVSLNHSTNTFDVLPWFESSNSKRSINDDLYTPILVIPASIVCFLIRGLRCIDRLPSWSACVEPCERSNVVRLSCGLTRACARKPCVVVLQRRLWRMLRTAF
jgi:hypothetical protein